MNRRAFLKSGALAMLLTPLAAKAREAAKSYRIGMLWTPYPEHPVRHAIFGHSDRV